MKRSLESLAAHRFLLLALAVLASCGPADDGPLANGQNPNGGESISISPRSASIGQPGGTALLSATATNALGEAVAGAAIAWASLDPAIATVSSGLVTGRSPGAARVEAAWGRAADTVVVTVNNLQLPPGTGSRTPAGLLPSLGPVVAEAAVAETNGFDSRFLSSEAARYPDALALVNAGAANMANHYGALRGRLMWAIRNGEPYGPGVTDVNRYAYARGRDIILKYLQWAKPNGYMHQPHNNTGLADIEALYVLEGTPEALLHIACTAQISTYDVWGYLRMVSTGSDPRQPAIALQAFNAAYRLGLPFRECGTQAGRPWDRTPGSWKAAGDRQISWLLDGDPTFVHPQTGPKPTPPAIKPNGAIPSPAHTKGWSYPNEPTTEAFLFNAMIAVELFRWHAYVEQDGRILATAIRVVEHMVDEFQRMGLPCLPYESTSAACSPDLAAFVVWPGLVAWQETGDQKYYDFAMRHLAESRNAYIYGVKQWNQTFSTLGMGVEALMGGVRWH